MPKLLWRILLTAAVGAVLLFGCGREPGQREYEKGVRALRAGEPVQAKTYLEKSINKRPGSDANAAAFNYLGVARWKLGETDRAIEAFEEDLDS